MRWRPFLVVTTTTGRCCSCSANDARASAVLGGQLFDQADVGGHCLLAADALAGGPSVELGATFEIEHAGAFTAHVARGRLLVECVQLEQLVTGRRARELFDTRLSRGEFFCQCHEGSLSGLE